MSELSMKQMIEAADARKEQFDHDMAKAQKARENISAWEANRRAEEEQRTGKAAEDHEAFKKELSGMSDGEMRKRGWL